MSDPPKKPGSLRDRIAAFENKGSSPAPVSAPVPRPKPAGGVSWKPHPRSPPASPPQSESGHDKAAGVMSAADAKASIGQGGSLKERMAALQGLAAFGGGSAPSAPPKPAGEKPKWKPPPVVHTIPAEGDDGVEAEHLTAHAEEGGAEEHHAHAEGHHESAEGEEHTAEGEAAQAEPDPEEEERQRRAAIAARIARLGGARVGMSPPVFGRKPDVPAKWVSHKDEEEKPEEHAPASQAPEDTAASHPAELTEAAVSQQSSTETTSGYVSGKDSASLLSTESASSGVRSPPMPVPTAPRRAAPPRKRAAKSPAPPAPIVDEVIHESPSPIPGTTPAAPESAPEHGAEVAADIKELEPHGDREPEIRDSQIALVEAELVKKKEAHEAVEQTPEVHPAAEAAVETTQPVVESIVEEHHETKPTLVEPEERVEIEGTHVVEVAAPEEGSVQAVSQEETEEDEGARRKRIAERLAKSGGINPLGGIPLASPPHAEHHDNHRRSSVDSEVASPRSPVRQASTDSASHFHHATHAIPESPQSPYAATSPGSESLGRKGSVGLVRSSIALEAPARRLSQDDQRTVLAEHVLSQEPREEHAEHAHSIAHDQLHEAPHEVDLEDVEEQEEEEEVESDYHETDSEQITQDRHFISDAVDHERHVEEPEEEPPAPVLHDEPVVHPHHIERALPPPPVPIEEPVASVPAPPPVASPHSPTKRLSIPPPRIPPPPPREEPSGEGLPSVQSPPPPARSSSLRRLSVPPAPVRVPPPPAPREEEEEAPPPPVRKASLPPLHIEEPHLMYSESKESIAQSKAHMFAGTEDYRISTYSQPDSASVYEQEEEREESEYEDSNEVEEIPPPPPLPHVSVPPPPPLARHEEAVKFAEEVFVAPPPPPPVPTQRKPSMSSRTSTGAARRTSMEEPTSPTSRPLRPPPPPVHEQEVFNDSDVDPIDPSIYSPQKPTFMTAKTPTEPISPVTSPVPSHAPPVPGSKPILETKEHPVAQSEHAPTAETGQEENSEQIRRQTIAERMAKLGGITFGAPLPPPVRRPQPPPPATNEEDHSEEPAAPEEQPEPEQAPEEEGEFARKQRIAARIAGMGGMRFGMLPTPMAPPASPQTWTHREETDDDRPPSPPNRTAPMAPPPPPPLPHDETPENASVTDDGEHVELESSEAEEVTHVEVEEEDVPPPVPSRGGRRTSAHESQHPPPVPQVTRPPVPSVPAVSLRTSKAIPATPSPFGYPPAQPPPPSTRPPVPLHESQSDYVMVEEAGIADEPPPPIPPPRTASMKAHPPPRTAPPPPPPPPPHMESGDSQWEMANVPQVDFGGETDFSLSAQWSEDSTSYPLPPPAKSPAQRPASQLPSEHVGSSHGERQLTADDLMAQWGRVGVQIHEAASVAYEKSKKALIGDGSFRGFITTVLSEVPNAVQPVPPFDSFGYLIYAQTGSAVQRRASDLMPGDVIVLQDAKFKGHKGLQIYHQNVGIDEPLIAIIGDYEVKKAKVKVLQANQHVGQQSVESVSYRLEDLKSGSVKIYRVLEK